VISCKFTSIQNKSWKFYGENGKLNTTGAGKFYASLLTNHAGTIPIDPLHRGGKRTGLFLSHPHPFQQRMGR
jgi:hypothetical protein